MKKYLAGIGAFIALAVFTVVATAPGTASAACPATPADCHHDRTPVATATAVPTSTPVPVINVCRQLDTFGQRFVRDGFGNCIPLQPAVPQISCPPPSILQPQVSTSPYGLQSGLYGGYNVGALTYVNGVSYLNGQVFNPNLYGLSGYGLNGFNNYNTLACVAPPASPTPVVQTNTVYIPVPAAAPAAAAPVVAPSLPVSAYSGSVRVSPPNTGDAGLKSVE